MARIALVCEPPDGGVAEHVARLATGLGVHGHEAVVFDSRRLPFRRDYAHPHLDARALGRLTRALEGFELVHAHAAKAGVIGRLAARLRGLPALYTPHCFPFVGEVSEARRRFGLGTERALAPLTAALICVCEDERHVARAAGIRAPLHVVHNGCPSCPAARGGGGAAGGDGGAAGGDGGAAVGGGGGDGALTVGAVTVLRRQKRLDVLLAAAPRILDAGARVVIAGDGPERDALRRQADPRVVFEPWRGSAAEHLHELDVYVLPSSWEAFPIGVLEALACGVPQVATDVGGTREAVTPETGILIEPRDPEALASAVLELLADDDRRTRMAAASRERHAAHFTLDRMIERTAAVYDEVLSTRRGRR
jgi:glycosyltransferase involved in cell wall biosynthesis